MTIQSVKLKSLKFVENKLMSLVKQVQIEFANVGGGAYGGGDGTQQFYPWLGGAHRILILAKQHVSCNAIEKSPKCQRSGFEI